MSQLCDGILCRLTARTGRSDKGEILAVQLGKKQTGQIKNEKQSIKRGHNNKLQTVTDTQQDITTTCKLSLTQNRT
jgi:hypothetical protein